MIYWLEGRGKEGWGEVCGIVKLYFEDWIRASARYANANYSQCVDCSDEGLVIVYR